MNDPVTPRVFDEAIAYAQAHETPWPRHPDQPGWGVHIHDPEPWNRLRGPVSPRGPVSGLVMRGERAIASWGEPHREDLTFSVAKTLLAILAGVAHDRGLIPDLHEPVVKRVPGIGFDDAHNAAITWDHLLRNVSEWGGSCFGLPDQVDRYRNVEYQPVPPAGRKGEARPLQAPGSYWEYNDVRINQLSLALLHLFREPLPEVLAREVMQPCGASSDWRWVGYDDAWVEIDGRRMPSVPGGTHWGAGVTIDCHDLARVGCLLRDGGVAAGGRRVLSQAWVERMRTPGALAPFYGMLVWLNTGRRMFPSLPESSWFAVGAGSSLIWIDPTRDAVTVVRWINGASADGIFARIGEALDRVR